MKNFILRFLCIFCAVGIALACFTTVDFRSVDANEPIGKMSSVYSYILNDYIETYGVLSTDQNGAIINSYRAENPNGLIYGDLLNFDESEYPYLVLFVADSNYKTVSCHIWHYSDETEKASRIAILEKKYSDIPENQIGEFNIGWNNKNCYISYNVYDNNNLVTSEFYTVVNSEAFMYINNPTDVKLSGVTDFNSTYFHSGIDISDYNHSLDVFFSNLKNSAAESVTYEDIVDRVNQDDITTLSRVLIRASLYCDFDIANYQTKEDYVWALSQTTSSDTFTQITSLYDLGDGIYYAMFDTTKSIYNYALLRKTDYAKNGYQILKVRTDCIPLADRELKQIKLDYMSNPLLYQQSLKQLKLERKKDTSPTPEPTDDSVITVTVGNSPAVTVPVKKDNNKDDNSKSDNNSNNTKNDKINIDKNPLSIDNLKTNLKGGIRFPVACIGGGISIALLTVLWIYLYSDK